MIFCMCCGVVEILITIVVLAKAMVLKAICDSK
jgi:hypothetical protein